ncbi:SDR family oxidoreductase [Steroidobacter agaridevorans]|uniref:SDR family oxidoreductase n=1 Tax=Steroidobacter agaridevorans TaxID=2695856 RepID=UPI00132359F8|nr:SDR family oxidoreductase [Steroidobacter agaridevorans]GFE85949.1 short chain dehydrogenase [Steroidobacter agaridevorans]
MNLIGKRVLITGASGGIGRALVAALLGEGAHVLLSGRDHAALAAVVAHHAEREHAAVFAADITNALDRARLCDFASRWRGGVDILINNAAVNDFTLLKMQSAESMDMAVATNLVAPIDMCRRLSPCLERSEGAHIINVGSVYGSIGFAGNSVYCATKFGLRGFSEALRRELADTDIQVHYFAPRATRTAFNSDLVNDLNMTLGNASDEPVEVARFIVQALQAGRAESVIGWPEKFFVRLNALLPRLVDMALAQKLSTIRHFVKGCPKPGESL